MQTVYMRTEEFFAEHNAKKLTETEFSKYELCKLVELYDSVNKSTLYTTELFDQYVFVLVKYMRQSEKIVYRYLLSEKNFYTAMLLLADHVKNVELSF